VTRRNTEKERAKKRESFQALKNDPRGRNESRFESFSLSLLRRPRRLSSQAYSTASELITYLRWWWSRQSNQELDDRRQYADKVRCLMVISIWFLDSKNKISPRWSHRIPPQHCRHCWLKMNMIGWFHWGDRKTRTPTREREKNTLDKSRTKRFHHTTLTKKLVILWFKKI